MIDELDEINFFTSDIITGIPQGKGAHDMSVMPETVASRVATSNSDVLVEAGESQLIRVEPNDSRVDCSNYNPLGKSNSRKFGFPKCRFSKKSNFPKRSIFRKR